MVTVPAIIPVTSPTPETVALLLLADHTPPTTASDSVIVSPSVTDDAPLIVPAVNALTVTTDTALALPQLFVTVYDTVVVPPVTPVTLPEPSTTALPFEELQTPPETASERVIDDPAHTGTDPVIVPATGSGLTVTTYVAAAEPQPLVTV